MRIAESIHKHWFLVGVALSIILAKINPWIGVKGGPLIPEITVKYLAVSIIFFVSGVTIKTHDLTTTILRVKVHLFIQIFTMGFVPVFVSVLTPPLKLLNIDTWVLKGLATVSCMPPPVSSAVILTKSTGGNEAAAIFNSALGSFLGVIVTPATLLYFVGIETKVSVMDTITQLSGTVVLPIIIGQICRVYLPELLNFREIFGILGQLMLLFIIYTTFCDTFADDRMGIGGEQVLQTLVLVLSLQIFLLWLSYRLCLLLSLSNPDTAAVMFCSTHKSLTLGIPILRILFGGFKHLSHISLPLLIYHPTQIILGGFLANKMRPWVTRGHQQPRTSSFTA